MHKSGWDNNIYWLWEDIQEFAQAHPNWRLLCADNPGISYGWWATSEDARKLERWWSITISDAKRTLPTRTNLEAMEFRHLFETAAGRQELCRRAFVKAPGPRLDRYKVLAGVDHDHGIT